MLSSYQSARDERLPAGPIATPVNYFNVLSDPSPMVRKLLPFKPFCDGLLPVLASQRSTLLLIPSLDLLGFGLDPGAGALPTLPLSTRSTLRECTALGEGFKSSPSSRDDEAKSSSSVSADITSDIQTFNSEDMVMM